MQLAKSQLIAERTTIPELTQQATNYRVLGFSHHSGFSSIHSCLRSTYQHNYLAAHVPFGSVHTLLQNGRQGRTRTYVVFPKGGGFTGRCARYLAT